MLPWFILGLCLLAALFLGARWFVNADPKVLARIVKWGGLGLVVAPVVYLGVTGRLAVALPALLALIFLARRFRGFRLPGQQAPPSPGQTSEVETANLAMTLNHDSGEMRGRVLVALLRINQGYSAATRLQTRIADIPLVYLRSAERFATSHQMASIALPGCGGLAVCHSTPTKATLPFR